MTVADSPPETVDAVDFARRLLGGRTTTFGWGGRTRVVIADAGLRARFEGALAAPAYRTATRAFRSVHALRHAVLPTGVVEGPPSSVREPLPACLDGLRPAAIIVGTPGPCRSLVIRWIDTRGRPTVALKIEAAPRTVASIRRELQALADPALTGKVPELLWAGTFEHREGIATSHVEGRPGSFGADGVVEAIAVLPTVTAETPAVPAHGHPWITRVLATTGLPDTLLSALPGAWPIVRMHGDLAPWNLIRRSPGTIVAIDWEASDPDGLPGVDLAHHAMATALGLRRTDARRIVDVASARLTRHLGFEEPAARAVVALTAAYVAHRQRGEANESAARRWEALSAYALDHR